MKKEYKVVILPTQKASRLFKETMNLFGDVGSKKLEFTTNETLIRNNHLITNRKAATNSLSKYEFYELYAISDDEVRDGDYYLYGKSVFKCTEKGESDDCKKLGCQKVIATTDKYLGCSNTSISNLLPQIPESFIQAYVKAYNEGKPITEIDLEMEPEYKQSQSGCGRFEYKKIKIRPDNTVIIHSYVDSKIDDAYKRGYFDRDNDIHQSKMYSREDVKECIKYMFMKERDIREKTSHFIDTCDLDKFIEDNL